MPRRVRPWYRRGRNMFHGQVQGRQILLGVPGPDTPENRKRAEKVHQQLIEEAARKAAEEAVRQIAPVPGGLTPPVTRTVADAGAAAPNNELFAAVNMSSDYSYNATTHQHIMTQP
jgi:hypothetical protein